MLIGQRTIYSCIAISPTIMAVSELLLKYPSCSTWAGYKTNSNRFRVFLSTVYFVELTMSQKNALNDWDITLPPHLPPTTLLTDQIVSGFSMYCVETLHLSRPSFNKMVSWQNEASRDIMNSQRRDFRATIRILRSQPWYREYVVKRAKTVPVQYLRFFEDLHITSLDTALPLLVFFLGAYGGGRVGDLHSKILLKHIKVHNTSIYGILKPIVTITLPAENDKGNGGAITFQCSCPGNHDERALGICNKLRSFQIVHKALLSDLNAYLRKWTDPDGVMWFKRNTPTKAKAWNYKPWKDWVKGVRLLHQVNRDKVTKKITGFCMGGINNRGMKRERITGLYHDALLMAGVPKHDVGSYTFHGLRRTAATIQMEFGDNLSETEVMKATRHTSKRCFRLYNQESVQHLARHTNRDTEIAYLTGVVSDWRVSVKLNANPNPVEISLLRKAIKSHDMTVHELRTDPHWSNADVIKLLLKSEPKAKEFFKQI